jgi:hypothetical protein
MPAEVDKKNRFQNISAAIAGQINTNIIDDGWQDIMWILASIEAGTAKPIIILNRLLSQPNHPATKALEELGKIERSLYLLRYGTDPELRRFVVRHTSHREHWNKFTHNVQAFGDLIQEKTIADQEEVFWFLTEVQNAIILWNALSLEKIIPAIQMLSEQDLKRVLPTITPDGASAGVQRPISNRQDDPQRPTHFAFEREKQVPILRCPLYPNSTGSAALERLNHSHVGNCVLQWRRHLGIFEHCLGEQITLNRVLVTNVQHYLLDLTSPLMPHSARLIRRGIEGYLDFNSPFRPKDIHSLVWGQLSPTGKCRRPLPKVHDAADKAIHPELRIDLYDPIHPFRLSIEDEARQRYAVASDIHQSSAAQVSHVTNIARVIIVIGEKRLYGSQFSNFSFNHHLSGALPLRVVTIHKGFHDLELGLLFGCLQQFFSLG